MTFVTVLILLSALLFVSKCRIFWQAMIRESRPRRRKPESLHPMLDAIVSLEWDLHALVENYLFEFERNVLRSTIGALSVAWVAALVGLVASMYCGRSLSVGVLNKAMVTLGLAVIVQVAGSVWLFGHWRGIRTLERRSEVGGCLVMMALGFGLLGLTQGPLVLELRSIVLADAWSVGEIQRGGAYWTSAVCGLLTTFAGLAALLGSLGPCIERLQVTVPAITNVNEAIHQKGFFFASESAAMSLGLVATNDWRILFIVAYMPRFICDPGEWIEQRLSTTMRMILLVIVASVLIIEPYIFGEPDPPLFVTLVKGAKGVIQQLLLLPR